jgi:hypothetical protein
MGFYFSEARYSEIGTRGLLVAFLCFLVSACVVIPEKPQKRPEQGDYTKTFKVPEKLKKDYEIQEDSDKEDPVVSRDSDKSSSPNKSQKPAKKAVSEATEKRTEKKEVQKKKVQKPAKEEKNKPGLHVRNIDENMEIPFGVGERLVMDLSYFGVTAGKLILEVLPYKKVRSRRSYHFRATVKSAGLFSAVYRVNDSMESFVDKKGFFPYRLVIHVDESKKTGKDLQLFDRETLQVHYWSERHDKEDGLEKEEKHGPFPPSSLDTLSSLFFLRMQDLEVGKRIEFPVVSGGKVLQAKADVLRKENVEVELGRYSAWVVKPEVHFEGHLKKTGDVFFWISDTPQRKILKIKAKIKIGSLVAEAESFKASKRTPSSSKDVP